MYQWLGLRRVIAFVVITGGVSVYYDSGVVRRNAPINPPIMAGSSVSVTEARESALIEPVAIVHDTPDKKLTSGRGGVPDGNRAPTSLSEVCARLNDTVCRFFIQGDREVSLSARDYFSLDRDRDVARWQPPNVSDGNLPKGFSAAYQLDYAARFDAQVSPQFELGGDGTQSKRPVSIDYRGNETRYAEGACNKLPEGKIGLFIGGFCGAPLLAQVGIALVLGFVTYGSICIGVTKLTFPKERTRRVVFGWVWLGFGLLLGLLSYGLVIAGAALS